MVRSILDTILGILSLNQNLIERVMRRTRTLAGVCAGFFLLGSTLSAVAQQVLLPAPRLLTTMPMGGQTGTTVNMKVTGQSLDGDVELLFSESRITAVPERTPTGERIPNQFTVTIPADVPEGVYEARALTRLGLSSSRAFTVGALPELNQGEGNTTLEAAMELPLNVVCNAHTTSKGVDFFKFSVDQKTRLTVEVAATRIDSRLKPVLMIADAQGRDLVADRRNGFLDWTAPQAGTYVIKVHGLTYEGGAESFYRLVLRSVSEQGIAQRHPTTERVNTLSIPTTLAQSNPIPEAEPNNKPDAAQKISLPCDIAGAFFPNADVDTFEFTAKKGEVWWVEVVSERLGLPTNPFALIQQVVKTGETENAVDLIEFNDLPSPVTLSTNGYAYNGPYYDVGTADLLGRLEIKDDGTYRIQLRDLFGGTRRDPRCTYRLIIRQAEPDFAVAAWAMHMELRNGDRDAQSKPVALRGGATMIFEVVAVRKDGFDGPIQIRMEELPIGMSAAGLTIPAGKPSGFLLITAEEGVSTVIGTPKILAQGDINGTPVVRPVRLASVAWPVRDATSEGAPHPRLMRDVAVSITSEELAPLTIAPAGPITAQENEKLTVPLTLTWRGEFSGALKLSPKGAGFEKVKPVDVTLNSPTLDVPVDLAELKLAPGEYVFTMVGGLVVKYRDALSAVQAATDELNAVTAEITALTSSSEDATAAVAAASPEEKPAAEQVAADAAARLKQAQEKKAACEKKLKAATDRAAPKEIVDIVVSEPIHLRVTPAEAK